MSGCPLWEHFMLSNQRERKNVEKKKPQYNNYTTSTNEKNMVHASLEGSSIDLSKLFSKDWTEGRNQQHFFGKSNISTVKFVELFPFASCFLATKLLLKLGFSCFAALCRLKNWISSLLLCMIWGTKGPEYSLKASVYLIVIIIIIICQKCLFANSIYMTNISYNASNMGCFSQKIKKNFFFFRWNRQICQKQSWKHYLSNNYWSKV